MNGTPLLLALIGHAVGDYLLQTDWMARNKKLPTFTGAFACVVHCLIWTSCVVWFAGWGELEWALLFAFHMAQDRWQFVRWWMSWFQRDFMEPDRLDLLEMRIVPGAAPWSLIVIDNVWHVLQIWFVWRFVA